MHKPGANMRLLLIGLITCVLTGCSSYDNGDALSMGAAATTGTLAYTLTDGKSKDTQLAITAATGIGTYMFGQYVNGKVDQNYIEKMQEGYRMGMADATKRQYEIIQNRQKEDESAARNIRYKLYEFPGVDHKNGINYHPHNVILRVEE
jgi:hypothetical protein